MSQVRVHLNREPTDPRLGRHQVHDDRSWAHAINIGATLPTIPADHTRYAPVLDQGNVGCCTAAAALGVLVTGPFWQPGKTKPYTMADVLALYHDETLLDDRQIPGHYPPDDTGSSFLASAKALQKRHLITSYQHTFTLAAMLTTLSTKPMSVGINWYQSMFKPDSGGVVKIGRRSQVAGGHEICFDGHDPARKLARFTNSWGTSWGDNGRAWVSWTDLDRLLHEGGDAGTFTL